jgi:glycosyltransferase involved in cell wall biosynthesis
MIRTQARTSKHLRVGLVVPHIFMQREILPHVIFSPASLALTLADGLNDLGVKVTLFSPGPVNTNATNVTADLTYFKKELASRGDSYLDLLKKHPFTFITLARQVQSELVATAYAAANKGELDIVHIYTNEEEIALPFANLCSKPVVFTHHDPFNFLIKYKNMYPKYTSLNWISISYAQRKNMPRNTNWCGNVYHGLGEKSLCPVNNPTNDYIAYLGRIIEPKGLHIAIKMLKKYNQKSKSKLKLKIIGKHYADHQRDHYWKNRVLPEIGELVEYIGFVSEQDKQNYLSNAKALIIPSIFDEPFGMVAIEALASGTPIIALNSGALLEIIKNEKTGLIASKVWLTDGTIDEDATAANLESALSKIDMINRQDCRQDFENRFTDEKMCRGHLSIYTNLINA